jgi:hypothetical protein
MGLMYVFPVSTEEADFVDLKEESVTLKSYGLPYIFWIYAVCVLAVVFFMFLAIKAPILKLVDLGDETDATLGYALLTFMGLIPIFLFGFFFYEKRIIKTKNDLTLQYRLFGLKVFSETFLCDPANPFQIESFLDSPNVARMKGSEESAGFQNKGYYNLWLKTQDGKKILVDRHSRKADLVKLQNLLTLIH